jgi:hypothetical protein
MIEKDNGECYLRRSSIVVRSCVYLVHGEVVIGHLHTKVQHLHPVTERRGGSVVRQSYQEGEPLRRPYQTCEARDTALPYIFVYMYIIDIFKYR